MIAICMKIGAVVAFGAASVAWADVVTFETLAGMGNPSHSSLTVQGYEFSADTAFFTIDSDPSGMYVRNGSQVTLAKIYGGAPVTMRRSGGGAFDLLGFDVGGVFQHPWNGGPAADSLHLVGQLAGGGTVERDVAIGTVLWNVPYVHVDLSGMSGVTAVTFEPVLPSWQLPGAYGLDNLVATPVPGGGVLNAWGLAAVVAARRRRA